MSYKKIILLVSFLIVFGFLFNFNTPVAEAMTTMEIQALIQQLQSQIAQLQPQLAEVTGGEKVWCHDFNRNLKYGNAGEEVRALQTALQKEGFYKRTITGDFDEYTASAVVGFQEKYKEDVLVPWGLEHGTDYVGPTTRAKLNKLYGCSKPSITVLSPNGGEKWVVGKTYEITWRSSGIDKVDVSLCGQIPIDIAGNCLPVIAEDISANLGKYSWTIPSDISPKDGYRIRIFDGKTNLQDDTDNYFSIVAPAPSITVLSPNGGEKWVRGNTYKITWSMEGIESVNVEYIKKGPEEFDVYYVISSNLYKGEAFYWDIPLDFPTGEYKIVVVEVVPSGGYATIDYSDNYFSIVEGGLGLKYIEIQLASLSEAVLQLAEKIKLLMRR